MERPIGLYSSIYLEHSRTVGERAVFVPLACGGDAVLHESEFRELLRTGTFMNVTPVRITQEASDGEDSGASAVGTDEV